MDNRALERFGNYFFLVIEVVLRMNSPHPKYNSKDGIMFKTLSRCLWFGLCAGTIFDVSALTISRIPESKNTPVIDGVINASEWLDAALLSQFCSANDERLSDYPVCSMVKYDSRKLYLAFRTPIPFEPAFIPMGYDSLDYYTVDSIDLSIAPPGVANWMKFGFERAGGKVDLRVAGQVRLQPGQWNPQWEVHCRILPQAYFAASIWEAEIAIPWSTLELSAPQTGMEIPVQICRHYGNMRNSDNLSTRTSSWAPVNSIWELLNKDKFGRFVLGGEKPVFRFDKYADFAFGNGGFYGTLTRPEKFQAETKIYHRDNDRVIFLDKKIGATGTAVTLDGAMTITDINQVTMQWKITDSAGDVAGGRLGTEIHPPFVVEIAPVYSLEIVKFLGDLRHIEKTSGNIIIEVGLHDSSGKTLTQKTETFAADATYFELTLPLNAVKPGETIEAVAKLLDHAGRLRYQASNKIKKSPYQDWMNKEIGKVTAPPPPWQPIKTTTLKDAVEIKIADNSYRFTNQLLPVNVKLRGSDFSADAFKFNIETTTGIQQFKSDTPLVVSSENQRGVTLRYHGISADLKLQADIRVEFDGLAWYEIKVEPLRSGTVVTSLNLSMPLQADVMRYVRAGNAMGTLEGASYFALVGPAKINRDLPKPNMPFVLETSCNGWKFGRSFNNFYWFGGEDRGMFFILPSRHNINIANEFSETVDHDGKFVIQFNLIDNATKIDGALNYDFGLMLTPSKTIQSPSRLRRIGAAFTGFNADGSRTMAVDKKCFAGANGKRFFHDPELKPFPKNYFTTAILKCWLLPNAQNGNPNPPDAELAEIAKDVAGLKKSIGGSPMLWYDSMFSMFHVPQAVDYQYEWERYPKTRLMVEQYGTLICPTAAWSDYYLNGAVKRMKQGVESFYMDMSIYGPCSNRFHGCGYRDKHGDIQGVIPFLAGREFYLRFQKLVKENNSNGLLVMHGSPISPLSVWMDVVTYGEEWTTAPDYSTLTPEFYQLCLTGTKQLGTPISFFPGLILLFYQQAQSSTVTLAEVCGMSVTNGESIWNGVEQQLPGLRLVWDAMDDFGVDQPDAEWIPYWRNANNRYPNGIIVSAWRRGGQQLLVLFNPQYKEQSLDLSEFRDHRISDALTGQKTAAGTLTLPSRGFTLLRVK